MVTSLSFPQASHGLLLNTVIQKVVCWAPLRAEKQHSEALGRPRLGGKRDDTLSAVAPHGVCWPEKPQVCYLVHYGLRLLWLSPEDYRTYSVEPPLQKQPRTYFQNKVLVVWGITLEEDSKRHKYLLHRRSWAWIWLAEKNQPLSLRVPNSV